MGDMADDWDRHIDDADDDAMLADEDWPGGHCGRWWGGKLIGSCSLAGTEDCDFECPYRASLYRSRPDA